MGLSGRDGGGVLAASRAGVVVEGAFEGGITLRPPPTFCFFFGGFSGVGTDTGVDSATCVESACSCLFAFFFAFVFSSAFDFCFVVDGDSERLGFEVVSFWGLVFVVPCSPCWAAASLASLAACLWPRGWLFASLARARWI